jgi:hypothetical protein
VKTPKLLRMVIVEWTDAFFSPRWMMHDEAVATAVESEALCFTVGFLFKENKKCVVVAGTLHTEGGSIAHVGSLQTIPRGMVRRITTLRVPPGR